MANIPTTAWAETTPSGGDNISAGDNRIREMKTQIREVIDVDHDFPSSGQAADVGQHKKVTLQEQADLGTGAVSATILGSQTVSGKGELVYTDEDDNDIQLTDAGEIFWTGIFDRIYPVGTVVTLGVSTNPATLFGRGTWSAIEGRVIVGIASSGTFDTLDATMGAETHTLTTDEMPAHTHGVYVSGSDTDGIESKRAAVQSNPAGTTTSTGGGSAHNNIQPSIVKYVWQRTA